MKRCTQNQILHHEVPALAVYLIAVLYSIEYFNKLTAVLTFYFQGFGSAWLECESEFLILL
jgi:hypothetical protein